MSLQFLAPLNISENTFLNGAVRVYQPDDGYRAGIDPVLLAAAVQARPRESVLDMGCGVGSAALCLAQRVSGIHITGIDIQDNLIALAKQNAALNSTHVKFKVENVKTVCHSRESRSLDSGFHRGDDILGNFDHVMANPPFMEAGSYNPSPNPCRAMGRGETDATLADWIDGAHRALKPGGYLTMLHRTDRLGDIVQGFAQKFGSIVICPLWPKQGQASKRVLISARKEKFAPFQLLPGLTLHNEDGSYTKAAQGVLVGSNPLILSNS